MGKVNAILQNNHHTASTTAAPWGNIALMRCLNDLRSTKLNKNVNVPKDFRLGSDEKFVSPPKQRRKRYQRKKSQIKGQPFEIEL